MKATIIRIFAVAFVLLTSVLHSLAAEPLPWPGLEYASAKAYLFAGKYGPKEIVIDGNLNSSVEKTVRLTEKQTQRISTAIQDPPSAQKNAMMCYDPHHAFVYFDVHDRPIAFMVVCFECGNYVCQPPLPKGKILNLSALIPLFKEAGIPAPGDAEFVESLNMEEAQHDNPITNAVYGFFSEAPEEHAKVWPWREIRMVKLLELSATARPSNPVVHLGELTKSIAQEATLSGQQKEEAWKLIQRPEWKPLSASRETKQEEGGEIRVRETGSNVWRGFDSKIGEPTVPRHALVCFDKKGRPFAWLTISFSDRSYTAYPREGPAHFGKPVWQIAPLQKLFEQTGVFKHGDYEKHVKRARRGDDK